MIMDFVWVAFVVAAYSTPVLEADMVSHNGQPICEEVDQLKKFISAIDKGDVEEAMSIKTCFLLKEGVPLTIIEPGLSDNVAKVRIQAHSRSFVVYTVLPAAQEETGY